MKEYEHECEFGSIMPIRFLDASRVKAFDEEGNEIMCNCGKPATVFFYGKEVTFAKCADCG